MHIPNTSDQQHQVYEVKKKPRLKKKKHIEAKQEVNRTKRQSSKRRKPVVVGTMIKKNYNKKRQVDKQVYGR